MKILSTKQLSEKQKEIFTLEGFEVVDMNFIEISPIPFKEEIISDLYIFTSKNAVEIVEKNNFYKNLVNKKAICVGEKTKQFLEKNNWQVIDYEHYAYNLGQKIIEKYHSFTFTFFCGELRRDTLPNLLTKNNIKYKEINLYKTIFIPKKMEYSFDAILFFSPSGVQSFLEQNIFNNEKIFCIGSTTAQTLPADTPCVIAEKPTTESIIKKCITYLKNKHNATK
ncbi:MAG: uroporphyrinogen-III synthase [Capnocytophaga sp.]|nr:uroporphyrinogen-III synthase [Capnocytophaga sp.]